MGINTFIHLSIVFYFYFYFFQKGYWDNKLIKRYLVTIIIKGYWDNKLIKRIPGYYNNKRISG